MNRKISTFLRRIKWSKYQKEILVFAFLLDTFAFLWVRGKPECCDVDNYLLEASQIKTQGFIPTSGTPWLQTFHNYLYPTFIFLAKSAGLTSRASITALQVILIIAACVIVSIRLSRILQVSRIQLTGLTLLIALFPILAFSGYLLTEALASPFLILWIGISLELSFAQLPTRRSRYLILATSLFSALLWMIRPSFLWIPVINLILILVLDLRTQKSRISRIFNALETTFWVIFSTATVVLPQYLITASSQSTINGIFHLDLWTTWRPMESTLYRYITNLSGCGPTGLYFSPYTQSTGGINSPYFHNSLIYRLTGFTARLVSGWDAVPSPLTYVDHLSIFPWVLLSAMTGFLITAPFFLLGSPLPGSSSISSGFRRMEFSIVLLFVASQVAAGMIHGEFRYNMAGWIIAGFSMLLLRQHFNGNFPWVKYISSSLGVSFFVIVVGQLTLSLSPYWIACVK